MTINQVTIWKALCPKCTIYIYYFLQNVTPQEEEEEEEQQQQQLLNLQNAMLAVKTIKKTKKRKRLGSPKTNYLTG